jgi:hypothetical protein
MAFDFGGLFTGMTERARDIRKEQHDREQHDFENLMQIGMHIMDSPHTPASMKDEATDMVNQALMTHLYPDQFKPTKNKLHKFVESYLGTDAEAQRRGYAQAASQIGVGRGNATTPVVPPISRAAVAPVPPGAMPAPPEMAMPGQLPPPPESQLDTEGMPATPAAAGRPPAPPPSISADWHVTSGAPAPTQAIGIEGHDISLQELIKRLGVKAPSRTAHGFMDPDEVATYKAGLGQAVELMAGQIKEDLDHARSRRDQEEIIDRVKNDPRFRELRDNPAAMRNFLYKIVTGASLEGSINPIIGASVVSKEDARLMGLDVSKVPTDWVKVAYDRQMNPVGVEAASEPSQGYYMNALMERAITAAAYHHGIPEAEYKRDPKWQAEITSIMQQIRAPGRIQSGAKTLTAVDGSTFLVPILTESRPAYFDFGSLGSGQLPPPPQTVLPPGAPTAPPPIHAPTPGQQTEPMAPSPKLPAVTIGDPVTRGGHPLTSADRTRLENAVQQFEIAGQVKEAVESLPAAKMGPVIGRVQQIVARVGAGDWLPSDVVTVGGLLDQALNRTLFGFGGKTLTATEVQRYSLAFSQLTQGPEQARIYAKVNLEQFAQPELRRTLQTLPAASLKGLPAYKTWAGWAGLDPNTLEVKDKPTGDLFSPEHIRQWRDSKKALQGTK